MKKSLIYTFIGAIIIYLFVCIGLYTNQTVIIFPARKEQESVYQDLQNIKYEEWQLTTKDKTLLMGWFYDSNPKAQLYIYYGGNAEDITSTFFTLHFAINRSLLAVNFRGYGKSQGQPTEKDLFSDALEVYDYMHEKDKDRPICLIGRSLGSGVACYVAASRKIKNLILITPYDSIRDVAQKKYAYIPISLLLKHPFDSVLHSEKITVPTLFLLAENDLVIPRENSMRLYDQWKSQKTLHILPDSNHNNILFNANPFQDLPKSLSSLVFYSKEFIEKSEE